MLSALLAALACGGRSELALATGGNRESGGPNPTGGDGGAGGGGLSGAAAGGVVTGGVVTGGVVTGGAAAGGLPTGGVVTGGVVTGGAAGGGEPVEETCNGVDDDGDGLVDEGLGLSPLGIYDLRTTELSTGDCTTCRWAFGNVAWAGPEGLVALWRLSFDGSHPEPNAIIGGLFTGSTPRAPEVLLERNVTAGFRVAMGTDRVAVTTSARWGSADRPAVFWLDPSGGLLGGPDPVMAEGVTSGSVAPDVVWTGSRFLVSWCAASFQPGGWPLMVSAFDAQGALVSQTVLAEDGTELGLQRLGVSGDRVLVVARKAPTRESLTYLLDGEGKAVTPTPQPLGDPEQDWLWGQASPTPDGWLVLGTDIGMRGYALATVGHDGSTRAVLPTVEVDGYLGAMHLIPAPGGGHLFVGSTEVFGSTCERFVQRLDDDGAVLDEWRSTGDEECLWDPFLVTVEGEAFLVYSEYPTDNEPNPVRAMHLGCGP